jgi:hypothetical protein
MNKFFQEIKSKYMIKTVILGMLVLVSVSAIAQVQTQIIGDSVRIRSNTGTAELRLENSTKNVNGFLFNKGDGRTEFRKGMIKVYDSVYIIGGDTLNLSLYVPNNVWRLNGNTGTNPAVNFLGTTDNNRLVLKTNNIQRMSVLADGTVNIGPDDNATQPLFRVYPNGDFTAKATNNLTNNVFGNNNGIRYTSKYGLFEVGTGNNFDTTISTSCCGSIVKSAIVINSDFTSTFKGFVHGSLVSGDGMFVDTAGGLSWAIMVGEHHYVNGGISKSVVAGWGHGVNGGGAIGNSLVSGISNSFTKPIFYNVVSGSTNSTLDTSTNSLISGYLNGYGGAGQFVSGRSLVNRTPYGTTIGNSNVDFASLPFTGLRGTANLSTIANLDKYPIFIIGNSKFPGNPSFRSNAVTILYNGRTQINTTGYDSNLVESTVTPKAALEVVSTNSGVLLPRLTSTQRNNIVSGDLHNGLLLYNTDSSKFQFYNGSTWKTIGDNGAGGSGGSGSLTFPIQTLTDGSTITWNGANSVNGEVILAGSGRTLSITSPVAGQTYRIKLKQDNIGSRTVATWPTGTMWPSGNPPTLSTTPSAVDMVTLYYDGTNFYGDSKLLYKAFTYDADAQKYFDSVATTGSLTLTEKNAWNTFVLAAKAGTNYWGSIAVINPVLGATSAEHAWNAKDPATFKATYSGTITHTANHMVSNGTTGFVNSHFNMNTNDGDGLATIAVWVRNNVDAVAVAMGAISATNRYTQIYPRFSNTFYGQVNTNNSIAESVTVSTSVGLSLATRLTSTGVYLQKDATQTSGTSSSLITNNDIYVLAQNSNGSAANFSTYQVCMYLIATTPFTTAQASQFYTDFSAFITAVGR